MTETAIRPVNLGIAAICFITAFMCKCPTLMRGGATGEGFEGFTTGCFHVCQEEFTHLVFLIVQSEIRNLFLCIYFQSLTSGLPIKALAAPHPPDPNDQSSDLL